MNAEELIKWLQLALEKDLVVPPGVIQQAVLALERSCDFMQDGKWSLVFNPPHADMSDEWNADNRWRVSRLEAPFSDNNGLRWWGGTTPLNAYKNAITSLELQ